jgi:hypothetical protein
LISKKKILSFETTWPNELNLGRKLFLKIFESKKEWHDSFGIFKLFFLSYPMKECQIINKRYHFTVPVPSYHINVHGLLLLLCLCFEFDILSDE